MSDKPHMISSIRIGVHDLWQLVTEVMQLRKQVTALQTDNTRLYLENQELRTASREHAPTPPPASQLDALPGNDGA